jgi:hypothetical protein
LLGCWRRSLSSGDRGRLDRLYSLRSRRWRDRWDGSWWLRRLLCRRLRGLWSSRRRRWLYRLYRLHHGRRYGRCHGQLRLSGWQLRRGRHGWLRRDRSLRSLARAGRLRRRRRHLLLRRLGRGEAVQELLLRGALDEGTVALDVALSVFHRRQLVAILLAAAVERRDHRIEELDLVSTIAVDDRPHRFDPDELRQAVADLRLGQHVALAEWGNLLLEQGRALSARRR